FLNNREHSLTPLHRHTFYGPTATSLRLSQLGYSNESQNDIQINYNNVESFVQSLRYAIQTSYPPYEKIGVKANGHYRQLNSNLLQIENEFYASIRPKRVTKSCQSPSRALCLGGVEYVEIRNIDLNPFVPVGIDADCIRFYDLLLLACMLLDSPEMDDAEFQLTVKNQQEMVMNGRNPDSHIMLVDGEKNSFAEMHELLNALTPLAELLDSLENSINYQLSLQSQRFKIDHPELTPSGQIVTRVIKNEDSFFEFAMDLAEETERYFKNSKIDPEISQKFKQLSHESHQAQKEIEEADSMSFDDFLVDYFNRQNSPMPSCGCGNTL
ncbi:MAG: glutamate--cysteine ligase, partial [Gammaproteobacteria bacterium]|nr:glutamate--cysteine ligase [Gammaproteobacteria bacterium]